MVFKKKQKNKQKTKKQDGVQWQNDWREEPAGQCEVPDVPARVCYLRVLHRKPSSWKTQWIAPILGCKARFEDMAFSHLHHVCSENGVHVLDNTHQGGLALLDIQELASSSDKVKLLRSHAFTYSGKPDMPVLALKDFDHNALDASEVLNLLLRYNAIEGVCNKINNK